MGYEASKARDVCLSMSKVGTYDIHMSGCRRDPVTELGVGSGLTEELLYFQACLFWVSINTIEDLEEKATLRTC